MYCYTPLPLDLHVLSLPLAFILSQDQTLHCNVCLIVVSFFDEVSHVDLLDLQGHLLFSDWTILQRTLSERLLRPALSLSFSAFRVKERGRFRGRGGKSNLLFRFTKPC